MRRFRFRLDPVVRYRKYLEQRAQIELAAAQQAVMESEKRIDSSNELRKASFSELEDEVKKGTNARTYLAYRFFIEKIERDIESEQQRLKKSIMKREEKREMLSAASTQRKSLERLKEIRWLRHKEESGLIDQKAIDELMILRRKGKEGIS